MRPGERGFTYIGALAAVAILGILLAGAARVWSAVVRHEDMVQLEWIGGQFEQAIGSYYESSPGSVKHYPRTVEDLLEDKRFVFVKRHLRMVYLDPFTGTPDWTYEGAPDGGFWAVRVHVPGGAGVPASDREFGYRPGSSN